MKKTRINYMMNENEIDSTFKVFKRVAIKGIVLKEGKVLLIQTNKGDYKFPGGGVKKGETIEDTLKREMYEETGFPILTIGDTIVEVVEKKLDAYEVKTIFEMESIYVTCDIDYEGLKEQNLDAYEAEQEFKPMFVTLESALKNNRDLIKANADDMNVWIQRETDVMRKLKEMGM